MTVGFLDDDAIVAFVCHGNDTVDEGEEDEDEKPVSGELVVPVLTVTEACDILTPLVTYFRPKILHNIF